MNQPKNMSNLPPEILIPIFVQLPIKDLVNLSKTCKRLNDVFEDELVWEQKVLLEYDINLKRMKEQSYKAEHNCSPKDLYRLLHKYGKLLGMWHRLQCGPRGSVYQVVYDEWSLKMFEWHPHILSERVFSDMKPVQFMRISINDGKELKEVFDPLAFLEEDKEIINDQYNLTNDPIVMAPTFDSENKLVEFQMEISNLGAGYDETAIKILETNIYQNFCKDIFDFDGSECESFQKLVIDKVYNKDVYSFQRLDPNTFFNETNQDKTPIPNGLFKGTYSSHGNEIISVNYNPQKNHLEGFKLTGDENVPCGEISFYADLSKQTYMSKEFQRNSKCRDLVKDIVDETYEVFVDDGRLTKDKRYFIKPSDVIMDDIDNFDHSIYQHRYIGEAQVAFTGFHNPKMIPAHVVIFDCNTFGVIFLSINYMGIYSRIKENLTAVHYEDVFSNVVPI